MTYGGFAKKASTSLATAFASLNRRVLTLASAWAIGSVMAECLGPKNAYRCHNGVGVGQLELDVGDR